MQKSVLFDDSILPRGSVLYLSAAPLVTLVVLSDSAPTFLDLMAGLEGWPATLRRRLKVTLRLIEVHK